MENFLMIVPVIGILALLFAIATSASIGKKDAGNDRMKEIAGAIAEGARAFLMSEYKVLLIFVVVMFVVIGIGLSNWMTAVCFLVGSIFSVLAGYLGMGAATKANVRTTSAAMNSGMNAALSVAFSGGSVMGLAVVGLGLFGISIIYVLTGNADILFGFSLGASSIALFARVGGGIYTKAADVGADLVGKVEAGIPEDDPRNPAVIADNVGDNVAGMGADLFESSVGSIISAMTLGLTYYGQTGVLFPLLLAAGGVVAAILGTFVVKAGNATNPHAALKRGEYGATAIVIIITIILSQTMFGGFNVALAVIAGLLVGVLIGVVTEIYTSDEYRFVKKIAQQSETGSATTIISGLAVGMQSTVVPILLICVGIFISY